jgi:hypothetical protein
MSPEVTAAIIGASVSVVTLIGTLAARYFGRRATSRDTQEALKGQGMQSVAARAGSAIEVEPRARLGAWADGGCRSSYCASV